VTVSYRISKGLKKNIEEASELTGKTQTQLFRRAIRLLLESEEFDEMREQVEDEKRFAEAFEHEIETGRIIHTFEDRDAKLKKVDERINKGNLKPKEGRLLKLEIINNYETTKKIMIKKLK
jgi:hypothetical protein